MMVRKGMQPGDTFEDGGRWFEVLAVNQNGTYESRQIYNVVETAESGGQRTSRSTKRGGEDTAPTKRRSRNKQ